MTKYEWETELKKNIHRLPADEIKRVMEYYAELFEDYIERGKTESQIINEFGNPVDVADKILSEYDGELVESSPEPLPTDTHVRSVEATKTDDGGKPAAYKHIEIVNEPVTEDGGDSGDTKSDAPSKPAKKGAGRVFKFVGLVLLAIVFFGVVACGAYAVIISFGVMAQNFGSGVVHLGIGIAVIGIGFLIGLPLYKAYENSRLEKNKTATDAAKEEDGHEDRD